MNDTTTQPQPNPAAPASADQVAAVHIVSPLNRSGTNFLARAIELHPRLAIPRVMYEGYLCEHADLLEQYVTQTSRRWGRGFREDPDAHTHEAMMLLGTAMHTFASRHVDAGATPIIKTPRPFGIARFYQFYPDAKLILLVRDGRDTVESAARTFTRFDHKRWMEEWRDGARELRRFMQQFPNDPGGPPIWYLVRYEDLIDDLPGTMRGVMDFLGYADDYPEGELASLPLVGSSTNRGGSDNVHWNPIEKPKDFKPLKRWAEWDRKRIKQFKKIAGEELVAMGYEDSLDWEPPTG